MGRKGRGNGKFYYAKQSSAAVHATSVSTSKYRAPTVGLEDMVFTIVKTKDASEERRD